MPIVRKRLRDHWCLNVAKIDQFELRKQHTTSTKLRPHLAFYLVLRSF